MHTRQFEFFTSHHAAGLKSLHIPVIKYISGIHIQLIIEFIYIVIKRRRDIDSIYS